MGGQDDHLTVSQVATALGTSPQTVRALLRSGQLRGVQRPWGSRFVWEVEPDGLDDFLAEYGRLEGRRRSRVVPAEKALDPVIPADPEPPASDQGPTTSEPSADLRKEDTLADTEVPVEPLRRRPWMFRPRGRAAILLVLLVPPLVALHAAAKVAPDALWFAEVGQDDVFRRMVEAKIEVRVLIGGIAAAFVWLNLVVAARGSWLDRRASGDLVTIGSALFVGSLFASSAGRHWQSYLLWRHPQFVGVTEPVHGRDVGYFLFTLPFELVMSGMLLWLVGVTLALVTLVRLALGHLSLRPLHATFATQVHGALLVSALLLATARRLYLERYVLELHQSVGQGSQSFAGAGYVDVHVRTPVLSALVIASIALALVSPALPHLARWSRVVRIRKIALIVSALSAVAACLALTLLPALVQRFAVDPNQLASEAPYVEHSAVATQQALGLDQIHVERYPRTGPVSAAAFRSVDDHLAAVTTWDSALLGARMRQLVTDTPYYSPRAPALDVVRRGGHAQTTIVSARELDTGAADVDAHTWGSDRLAYTHGLGLIRFSGTEVGPDREPVLLDSGSNVRQPRIYFGDLASPEAGPGEDDSTGALAPTAVPHLADSPWVLVDTRRPEVDVSSTHAAPQAQYHYQGPAGIPLSTWTRRTIFALALGSKQLLLSDDVTKGSRILLHRDIHDRLHTLAPFIDWDAGSFPMTVGGHIVFVVDGYTTSDDYPFAQQVTLGDTRASYARPSVRATVDAYTGAVTLYVTDPSDPLIRCWAAVFPTLFRPADQMPSELRHRGRYPAELFSAQATAYERFHTEDPDVLATSSDVWSRPIALSGPLEVAGGVDFDESDEDDLRLTLQPDYSFGAPPGRSDAGARLLLNTYYTPRRGQNLVATLTGWVDQVGRPHLVSRSLTRDPVVLGPAQVSRLVFATPRVRNLLGLRNLEIRDLETSSLDSVYLGRPHLLFLPEGLVQTQSLFEGSRGPGAARLLGVTVFVNGRAGLGPDVTSALRQALNRPPAVDLRKPHGPASVGVPVRLGFRVDNARREDIVIRWGHHRQLERLHVTNGRGAVQWTPRRPGRVRARISVTGLDGTTVRDAISFTVMSRPPVIRLVHVPRDAIAGQPVRIVFSLAHSRRASVRVSTRAGIVFERGYVLDGHVGVLKWTPQSAGPADVLLKTRGRQGQTARASLRLHVRPSAVAASPVVELLHVPTELDVGTPSRFALSAQSCQDVTARISGPEGDVKVWRFPCPARRATFAWTPRAVGSYELTVVARSSEGLSASQAVRLRARAPETGGPP